MVDVVNDWASAGRRVAAEVAERAWTPNDVYRRAGVDPKTLARIIDGNQPRGDVARRLARLFGWRDDALARLASGQEPVAAASEEDRLSAVEADLAEIRSQVEEVVRRLDRGAGPA